MQTPPLQTVAGAEAKPYGPIGLVIGSIAIALLSVMICGVVVGITFAVAAAIFGVGGTMDRVTTLASGKDETTFLVRAGLIVSLLVYAAVVLAILAVARIRGGAQWREIVGLRPWHPFRGTKLFWAAAGAAFVYNICVSALITWIYPASKDWIATPSGLPWVAGFVVLAVVFAPIAEEMVFRGWLYTSLNRFAGVKITIAVTSVLFALAHWESTHLYALAVLPVGVALGWIRHKTGTIVASITFHAFYNGAASILLVFGQ